MSASEHTSHLHRGLTLMVSGGHWWCRGAPTCVNWRCMQLSASYCRARVTREGVQRAVTQRLGASSTRQPTRRSVSRPRQRCTGRLTAHSSRCSAAADLPSAFRISLDRPLSVTLLSGVYCSCPRQGLINLSFYLRVGTVSPQTSVIPFPIFYRAQSRAGRQRFHRTAFR